MSAGPWTWLLGRLDALLPEGRHQLSPAERSRDRVVVGAALLLALLSLMVGITAPSFSSSIGIPLIGWASLVGFGLVLLYVRKGGSPRLASYLVCATLLCGYSMTTYVQPPANGSAHATSLLIPLLAVYLIGVKPGLLFTGLLCLNTALLLPLYRSGLGRGEPFLFNATSWTVGFIDSLVIVLGWGLCALFGLARDEAVATVRDSERNLHSLLESTTDPVCSLDPQGRIIKANSVARQMFQEMYGLELHPGDSLDKQSEGPEQEHWRKQLRRVFQGESLRFEWARQNAQRAWVLDLAIQPLWGEGGTRPVGATLFGRDITARKEAEVKLGELHRGMLEVSRQAGMAEMATGVLHNVGNMFNSVNVSASLVLERLRGSRTASLQRVADLLSEHEADLPAFLAQDPQGRQLPRYLSTVSRHLVQEQEGLLAEMRELLRHMEHIRAMVSMQQENARVVGQLELVQVGELLEDALRLHTDAFERLGIRIHRDYALQTPVHLDRHRLLQILVNLLGNARHALVESGREDKRLSLRARSEGTQWLCIEVEDNGVGIAPEHLGRMFTHGFTTKKDGHGFGLHSSAMAAEAMRGRLRCDSAGRGQGARFTLELPLTRTLESPEGPR